MSAIRVAPLPRRLLGFAVFTAILTAILATTWFAYRPGLSGAFLFDDLGSLPKLGATGPVDNWATFWRYITSGTADPTGRPLALLSFLIDAHNWPTNPYPFKVTNVILHMVNGALLAWVLWRLGRALFPSPSGRGVGGEGAGPRSGLGSRETQPSPGATRHHGVLRQGWRMYPEGEGNSGRLFALDDRGIAVAALFGAGAWLLHPLLVSTTLYVVQREAMLPATFVLIGMLGWMASREALARGHLKRALVGFALSAWLCTLLAVLSKANGALLPLLLLLTEWIVLARQPMPDAQTKRWRKRAVAVFLILPSVLLGAYLLSVIPGDVGTASAARGWTIGQRLLTEPRVLTDYLRLLFLPRAHSSGLFNDAFPVSTGWLHPASTLPSIALIVALIGAGFALRKRYPAIALALLFYFAAQIMESGWIPLELYFEHRNYLPSMLLFWPIGILLAQPGTLRFLRAGAAALVLIVLAATTTQRSALWGDAPHQARIWAAFNVRSARAQTSAALYDLQSARPRVAAARLELSLPLHPNDLQIPVNLITAECRLGNVHGRTLAAARRALTNDPVGGDVAFNWFGEALQSITERACSGLEYANMQALLDAARRNLHWQGQPGLRQNLEHLQAQLDLAEGKPDAALQSFNRALAASPKPAVALQQAAYLGAQGYPRLGMDHLEFFARLPRKPELGFGMFRAHAWVLERQQYWQRELAHLRASLEVAAGQSLRPGS